ncbi:SDR family oxidoreductase [Streptomyces sp. NPDC000070]|uniref:SDR family oxidoreductase n=1 Tax=Streptomyces sp. NPDC000070 TaxID=3154240 RepID=UPI00331ED319
MGSAVARRLGSGRTLILADHSRERLDRVVTELGAEGYAAQGVPTDVRDRAPVERLARTAAERGRITAVVHTAGVAAATASAGRILDVDLLGTVYVIEEFEKVAVRGTSLVCVAGLAGHMASIGGEDEAALATAPAEELLGLKAVTALGDDPTAAYILAKRANHVRVQAAALALEPARRPYQQPGQRGRAAHRVPDPVVGRQVRDRAARGDCCGGAARRAV